MHVGIREAIKTYCTKHTLTPCEMFELLDDDKTGVISKQELQQNLEKLQLKVTEKQMADIWPMINVDGGRQITVQEFEVFLEGRVVKAGSKPDPKLAAIRRRSLTCDGSEAGAVRRLSQQAQQARKSSIVKSNRKSSSSALSVSRSSITVTDGAMRKLSSQGSLPSLNSSSSHTDKIAVDDAQSAALKAARRHVQKEQQKVA